jgi:hypothetical protein
MTLMKFATKTLLILAFLAGTTGLHANERLKGIACRSVHLNYPGPAGVAFYNEVRVDQSAPGTYFCVCAFEAGYFGLQELADGRKVVLFSVWDPGSQNNPDSVENDRRAKVLFNDPAVRVQRFGGEGTGAQSFFDFDWKIGETYKFGVTADTANGKTTFAAYFFLPAENKWKHLATFQTITGGKPLRGFYSFVEDFRRNCVSTTQVRKAYFGGTRVQTKDRQWVELTRAQFTADSNPVTNIDAGVEGNMFFLTTGGETTNTHTPLWKTMDRIPTAVGAAPSSPLSR